MSLFTSLMGEAIIVDQGGGHDHTTVQSAVDTAGTGDAILIWAGTYYENVVVNRSLMLIGNGTTDTIIDGGGVGDVISIRSDTVLIRGLTVRNGGAMSSGVELGHADMCRVEGCVIYGNRFGIHGGNDQCDNNTINGNQVHNNTGTGISLEGIRNQVSNNTCMDNHCGISIQGRDNDVFGNKCFGNDYGAILGHFPSETLLMGNSYTASNSLDRLLEGLLKTGMGDANADSLSAGGLTLADHADRAMTSGHFWNTTLNAGKPWDHVVLQDQSQIPGFPTSNQYWQASLAGVKVLDSMIEDIGAETVLLLTWGRRDGDPQNSWRYPDFSTMQGHLETGYRMYAENITTTERSVYIAPVGLAWKHIHDGIVDSGGDPTTPGTLFHDLYAYDGSHPSLSGSYLAACVLFATLTGQTPVGLKDTASLGNARRLALQEAAAATVFNETPTYVYPWQRSTENNLVNNTLDTNGRGLTIGIRSDDNAVERCSFTDNDGRAISILDPASGNNIVHHNRFVDNNDGGVQAWDAGIDNAWDDGDEGNYWSDYTSRFPGATNDGTVWDTPYSVDGDGGGSDDHPLVGDLVPEDIEPPRPDAGPDRDVDEGAIVTFDGTGSRDNVGIVNFTWTFTYRGTGVVLTGPAPSFGFDDVGTFIVTLNVTDAAGNWAKDWMLVRVRDITPPVADAGPDLEVDQRQLFELDGRTSTDNVGVVNWTWELELGDRRVTLFGANLEYRIGVAGRYQTTLRVMDGGGNWATDTLNVTVRDIDPPVAIAGPDQEVHDGSIVKLDGSASYDNVVISSYNWSLEYEGETVHLEGSHVEFKFNVPGVYTILLRVMDGEGSTGTDLMNVYVRDVTPPVAVAGDDIVVERDTTVHFDGTGSWDDVEITDWNWTFRVAGISVHLMGATPSYTFSSYGEFSVHLVVTDPSGNRDGATLTVSVRDGIPPMAFGGDDRTVDQFHTIIFDGSASSDNVGITEWNWVFEYDGVGVSLFEQHASYRFDVPGDYRVTLKVTDAEGNSHSSSFTLTVLDILEPTAVSQGDIRTERGEAVIFDASASSDNVGIVRWTWTFEEGGKVVVMEGMVVELTFEEAGIYDVTLMTRDATGNEATEAFTVTVDGGLGPWLPAVLIIIVLSMVLVAWFIWRSKG